MNYICLYYNHSINQKSLFGPRAKQGRSGLKETFAINQMFVS